MLVGWLLDGLGSRNSEIYNGSGYTLRARVSFSYFYSNKETKDYLSYVMVELELEKNSI